jgi:N-acetylglucosaminylphosphatidylinositol deacetylase
MILLVSSLIISSLLIYTSKCYFWLENRRVKKFEAAGVLLVIAHPDDETMFFAPSLVSLHELGVSVRILCLSNGTV